MNVSGERTTSIWGSADVSAEPLNADTQADVIVIGSGIAGMSVAYELAIAGQSVVVIDRGPIAGGMTARTTAHLSAYCDDGFRELIRMRGLETAKRWYESQSASISRIESIYDVCHPPLVAARRIFRTGCVTARAASRRRRGQKSP